MHILVQLAFSKSTLLWVRDVNWNLNTISCLETCSYSRVLFHVAFKLCIKKVIVWSLSTCAL